MKWFEGNASTAIKTARSRNAIFVVYCEGADRNSERLTEMINNEEVSAMLESEKFVAIKIQSDKEEYIQFAKIYQLVPLPSIFFIKNGIPIKIITGTIKSVSELKEAIDKLSKESDSAESENLPPAVEAAKARDAEAEKESLEKLKRALKMIEQKRNEKVQEEQKLEKEKEIQRRKEGQDMQNLRKWQEDQELKQIKEERMKEKLEARAAKQRVLEQIEQDKKERAQKFGNQSSPTEAKTSPTVPSAPAPATSQAPNTTRIQFKKPDGESEIVTFDSDMLFGDVHAFVNNDILHGAVKDFALATTFPRKEFSSEDFDKDLIALNLIPSAVLLIIIKKKTSFQGPSSVLPTQTDGSFFGMITALASGLFSPIVALFTYLKNFIMRTSPSQDMNEAGIRKRDEETLAANDAAKKRNLNAFSNPPGSGPSQSPTGTIPKTTGAYKRQTSTASNNVHRLHEDSDSEDDERKTWNGNSTQQM